MLRLLSIANTLGQPRFSNHLVAGKRIKLISRAKDKGINNFCPTYSNASRKNIPGVS